MAEKEKVQKLISIIKANGKPRDDGSGSYDIKPAGYYTYYCPSPLYISHYEPFWGSPKHIYSQEGATIKDGSCVFGSFWTPCYVQNISGAKRKATLGTLIKNILSTIREGSKLEDYDDKGHYISK